MKINYDEITRKDLNDFSQAHDLLSFDDIVSQITEYKKGYQWQEIYNETCNSGNELMWDIAKQYYESNGDYFYIDPYNNLEALSFDQVLDRYSEDWDLNINEPRDINSEKFLSYCAENDIYSEDQLQNYLENHLPSPECYDASVIYAVNKLNSGYIMDDDYYDWNKVQNDFDEIDENTLIEECFLDWYSQVEQNHLEKEFFKAFPNAKIKPNTRK